MTAHDLLTDLSPDLLPHDITTRGGSSVVGPAHTTPCVSAAPRPPTITCFRDAVGVALELGVEHRSAHAGVLLDDDGLLLELRVHGEPGDSVLSALDCLYRRLLTPLGPDEDLDPTAIIVLSFDADGPPLSLWNDRRLYRWATQSFALIGVALRDWIWTDGEAFGSLAYACHPLSAWPGDPAASRLADRALASGPPGRPPSDPR